MSRTRGGADQRSPNNFFIIAHEISKVHSGLGHLKFRERRPKLFHSVEDLCLKSPGL